MNPPSFLRLARGSPHMWMGAFFLVASFFLFKAAVDEWRKGQRIQREGVRTEAIVASRSIDPARREGNRRTRYLVGYRFLTAEGKPVERTEEVPVEEWERLVEGGPASITYLPSDPANAQAAAPVEWWTPLIVAGGGVLFGLVGGLLTIPGFRRILLIRRLHREGETAEGTVLAVWATGTAVNRVRQWRLRYEIHDRMGRAEKGESDLLAPEEAARWKPGDRGMVRFDPLCPKESIWLSSPPGDEVKAEGSPSAPPEVRGKLPGPLRLLATIAVALVLVFVTAVLAELPPVKDLVGLITRHQGGLLVTVVAILSLGFLVFMGGILSLLMAQGEPMGRADVEDHERSVRLESRPAAWRVSSYRFRGKSAGRQGSDAFTFGELKDAWRRGLVWRDPTWRRRLVIVAGGLSMAFGLLGLFVVIGPPWLKVLVGAVMLYALARITWGFWKA